MPAGPTGVAIDDQANRAVVWSQFDAKVSIVDLNGTGRMPPRWCRFSPIPLLVSLKSLSVRQLFNTTDDLRIANDGVACASCHPDGRDDAFNLVKRPKARATRSCSQWPRGRAPSLTDGRANTAISKRTLVNTFLPPVGGSGVTGPELDALMAYSQQDSPGPPMELAVYRTFGRRATGS